MGGERDVEVPAVVCRKAELAGAQRWRSELPTLIATLERVGTEMLRTADDVSRRRG